MVEPSALCRNQLAATLRRIGCRVEAVASGRDAVAAATRAQFDAVVSELVLPDGSWERLRESLRPALPEAPLVIVTSHGSVAAAVHAIRRGVHDFLLKPATAQQLSAALGASAGAAAALGEDTGMSLDRVEWEHIHRVLFEVNGNISEAARRLRLHRQSLQRKLRKPPAFA